ncbi:MAG: dual specificity protein phosphatase family protein [Paracoccaceae bacterium]|jgi:protein-tyrosine phosphatase
MLNFDLINLPNVEGKICLSAFPGRCGKNEFSYNRMETFFNYLENNRFAILVSLTEESEFDQFLPKEHFLERLNQRNFDWRHHPIKDMTPPDSEFLLNFSSTHSELVNAVRSGFGIAIHCKGGLGRSGTIAALLLRNFGFSSQQAIQTVRKTRPGSIETKEQELFLLSFNNNDCFLSPKIS